MADHATSDSPAVQHQLNRFAALSPGRDILGLERIGLLLNILGNPQNDMPPVFHVAGTNGKGSTCAFLRAAIEAQGLTTHVYSSPHLVRFNERIRVAGHLIDDAQLAAILEEVLDAAQQHEIGASFFEITTAAAFLAFARTPADACVIEVGLGGRLDATNIIKHPAACGIASLGIDHEAFLLSPEKGTPDDPLSRIGWEKAGIAKPNVPIITGHYPKAVTQIIAQHAKAVGAPLFARKDGWDAAIYNGKIAYRDAGGSLKLPLPKMAGAHQVDNAALAIAMLRHQDIIKVSDAAMMAAMEWAHWPARLQKLGDGPLTRLISPDNVIWLDGGHNPDAGKVISQFFTKDPRKLHVICCMLSNKDAMGFLKPFADKIASFQAVPITGHDHHSPETLCDIAQNKLKIEHATIAASVHEAIKKLADITQANILISGTLYLAGDVLRENEQMPV